MRRSGTGVSVQSAGGGSGVDDAVRVGFTVSKKVHKRAVVRNRIKRRLREIIRREAREWLRPGHDYVIVARREALELTYARLCEETLRTIKRVHK